jgi:hypothetical protein
MLRRRRLKARPAAFVFALLLGASRSTDSASSQAEDITVRSETRSGKDSATRSPFKDDSFAARGPIEATFDGVVDLEAHFRRPGETRAYFSRRRFLMDAGSAARLDWTTWSAGDSAGEPESFLSIGTDVFHRDSPSSAWQKLGGERAELARFQIGSGLRWLLFNDPRASTLKLAAPRGGRERWTQSLGRRRRELAIESGPRRTIVLEDLHAHPRLGDVRDRVAWRFPERPAVGVAGEFPESVTVALHERDHQWVLDEALLGARVTDEDSLLARPVRFEESADDPDSLVAALALVPLAPGVWAADMEDLNTRSLIVEFADHLAVIELAVGSVNGERVIDVAKARWPSKPVRWMLFSHHHPHYAGGLRAAVATGARIVTTPGNERFVRDVVRRPFTLEPDRLARAPRPLALETFDKRFELADSTNRLVAVNIGARSDHTDEFVIFWLPRAGLVFETEQGWFTSNGELSASRRAEGFLRTLDDEKIAADRFVQSWPMRGTEGELTRARLEELIVKRKR